jgi:hypothetical protein
LPPHLSLNSRNRSRKWRRSCQRGHRTSAPAKACVGSTTRKIVTGTGVAQVGDNLFSGKQCHGFARRSPRFSSDNAYLCRLSRSISRRVSSGVRARVMSLDSPPNGIAFPFTSPFICWSMVCVGVLGLSETAAFGGGAFPSALSSARALGTAPSRAMADTKITACFIAPLLRKRRRPRQGSRLAFRPRT